MSYVSPTVEYAGGTIGKEPQIIVLVVFGVVAVDVVAVVAAASAAVVAVAATEVAVTTSSSISEVAASVVGCFAKGTKVAMGDGSFKNIEDVQIRNLIKAYDERRKKYTNARVIKTFYHAPHETANYLVINGNLKVTTNHLMYANNKWKRADELKIGDSLLNVNGNKVKVHSIDKVFNNIPVYNLEVERYRTYFADGILVHNSKGIPAGTGSQQSSR